MKLSTEVLFTMVIASTLSLAPMALADSGPRCSAGKGHLMSHHAGHRHGSVTGHLLRHLMKNKQEIGLTDDQIAKLRATALEADRMRIRAEADMMVSERELRSLLWDEKADMPVIEAKVREKESFEATVRIIGIKANRDLVGVLTPEQKAKLKGLWEQHRQQEGRHMMRTETDERRHDNAGIDALTEAPTS